MFGCGMLLGGEWVSYWVSYHPMDAVDADSECYSTAWTALLTLDLVVRTSLSSVTSFSCISFPSSSLSGSKSCHSARGSLEASKSLSCCSMTYRLGHDTLVVPTRCCKHSGSSSGSREVPSARRQKRASPLRFYHPKRSLQNPHRVHCYSCCRCSGGKF